MVDGPTDRIEKTRGEDPRSSVLRMVYKRDRATRYFIPLHSWQIAGHRSCLRTTTVNVLSSLFSSSVVESSIKDTELSVYFTSTVELSYCTSNLESGVKLKDNPRRTQEEKILWSSLLCMLYKRQRATRQLSWTRAGRSHV